MLRFCVFMFGASCVSAAFNDEAAARRYIEGLTFPAMLHDGPVFLGLHRPHEGWVL